MDEAVAVAGVRQIFVLKEVAQPAVARIDAVADDRDMRVAQPGALALGDRVREVPDRAGIRRLLGRRVELGVELADDVADGELGVDHARFHALAEAGDHPVEHLDELAVAAQIVLIILDVAERRGAFPRRERRIESVEAGEMVDRAHDRQRHEVRLQIAQIVLALISEHVIGDAIGGIERIAVDRLQRRQILLGRRFLGGIGFVREPVAEPVGIAIVAAEHALQRVAPKARLVAFAEQPVQPLAHAFFGGSRGRGGRLAGLRRGRRGDRNEKGGQQRASGHGLLST